jgi:hypothetical protein
MIANMGPMAQPTYRQPTLTGAPIYEVPNSYMPAHTPWHQPILTAPVQPTMELCNLCQSPAADEYWKQESQAVADMEPPGHASYPRQIGPSTSLVDSMWQSDPHKSQGHSNGSAQGSNARQ